MQVAIEELFSRWRERRDPRDLAAVFDACANELWQVGYHLCSRRSEADDLLQATFLEAMQSAAHWRSKQPLVPWLCGILANQLRMQRRRDRRAARPSSSAAVDPVGEVPPAVAAERSELRELLQVRVERLDEPYRAVLVLQLEHGLTPAEIAHALGRSRATVRSQLQRGLEQLRRGLPLGLLGGAARAMVAPNFATVRAAVVAASGGGVAGAFMTGSLLMAKKMMVAGLLVVVTAIGAWTVWSAGPPPAIPIGAASVALGSDRRAAGQPSSPPVVGAEVLTGTASDRVALSNPIATATTGALRAQVRWADGTAAAGMVVTLLPALGDAGFFAQREQKTDAAGSVEWQELALGDFLVATPHDETAGEVVNVRAGVVAACTLRIPVGVDVHGVVVDEVGQLVPNATIVMGAPTGQGGCDRMLPITTADGNGAFFLRSVAPKLLLAAFAETRVGGFAQRAGDLAGKPLAQLQVYGAGVAVEGRVVTADGLPIVGAWVASGSVQMRSGGQTIQVVRADATGRFRLLGQNEGFALSLQAGALGYATWHENLRRPTGRPLEIRLARGATIRGTVDGGAGSPVVELEIERIIDAATPAPGMADQRPLWCRPQRWHDDAGHFRIDHLAPGAVQLVLLAAGGQRVAFGEFVVGAGEQLVWDAQLLDRPSLQGRIVDEQDQPLVGWRVMADRQYFSANSQPTDPDGRFAIADCLPATYDLLVYAAGEAWNPPVHRVPGVAPGGEPITIRVPRAVQPSCRVRGVVGGSANELSVMLIGEGNSSSTEATLGKPFEIGPVPPGRYTVVVAVPKPDRSKLVHVLASAELVAGQVLDLGERLLPEPCELVVEMTDVAGQPVPQAELVMQPPDLWQCASLLHVVDGRAVAKVLPGTYALASYLGGECIEQAPFAVRSSERTVVQVRCRNAVMRHFVFAVPLSQSAREGLGHHIVLRKDGVEVWRGRVGYIPSQPHTWDRALSPGNWQLELQLDQDRSEHFPFVVTADAEAPPIEIRIAR